ncbi:uncharacterized protein FPRO_07782 [Fusarium proliferatum ET1]|uniref:Uncharacterized protein n=1 Tax=Fusarium proliferatum (strain ET1) TaxID=1227346 RepID=A0A1L7VSA7_FUSPR|nr:uncharacterized protein FPRO_07782 [Fusarium proliferatum ET1]CZR43301.1 uncharacterized protein FPRO_07782 [Fusarium proliferatum ET1]
MACLYMHSAVLGRFGITTLTSTTKTWRSAGVAITNGSHKMTLSGGIPFSLVESAIIGLHGRPRNMAFRLNLVPGQASDHCYQRGHQRLFMALELSETATSSGRPRRSPREAEEEEYESSTNWEGNPDLFESTAPESATAKSKSAPLKAGNNVETLPSELRAARREKQKAIRTPTNTSRGRGRSGSGGLGYLPTPRSNDSNAGPSVCLYGIVYWVLVSLIILARDFLMSAAGLARSRGKESAAFSVVVI